MCDVVATIRLLLKIFMKKRLTIKKIYGRANVTI